MNKVDGILRLDVKLDVDHDDFYCDFIKPDPIKFEDRTWLKIPYGLLRPSDAKTMEKARSMQSRDCQKEKMLLILCNKSPVTH